MKNIFKKSVYAAFIVMLGLVSIRLAAQSATVPSNCVVSTINGPTTISGTGDLIVTYSCTSIGQHVWSVPTGASIVGTTSNNTVVITFSSSFTSGTISVRRNSPSCIAYTQSIFVTRIAVCNITVTATAGTIACKGGSTTVNVTTTGGTGPYSGAGNYTASAGTHTYTVTDAAGCQAIATVTISEPTKLEAGITASEILCNGDLSEITVTATGGTAPYTGTGIYTAKAGTHTYTITDAAGCTTTSTVSVSEPTKLEANSTSTNILCNGGTSEITVSATGGTSPYTGTGVYTVNAGTYSYTVSDMNGCTATTQITVTQPEPLVATATSTDILCYGGTSTITVSASGGTYPYSGVGNYTETAGTYTYNITDNNGCEASSEITITEPPKLVVNAGNDAIVYYGYSSQSCTVLTASYYGGTGNVIYQWSDGSYESTTTVCPSATTQYTVTATDENGCQATDVVSVCVVDVVCYAGNSGNQKVEVCHNGHTICISANAVPAHLAHGCRLGSCTDDNNCDGITTNKSQNTFAANDKYHVELLMNDENGLMIRNEEDKISYDIIAITGQYVKSGQFENGINTVSINELRSGVYLIRTEDNETIKFVK